MIWPTLEAWAEIQKYFHSFFCSNENFKICFRDLCFLVDILKSLVESKVCNSTIRMDTNLQTPGWGLKYWITCSRTAFERNCQMHILLSGTIVSVLLWRSILMSKKRCFLNFHVLRLNQFTVLIKWKMEFSFIKRIPIVIHFLLNRKQK